MGIFRDDDEEEEEYTGHTGDPIHDEIYGWDMGSGSLRSIKKLYEIKLKEARKETYDEKRIRYYLEAMEYAEEYFENSEKWGVTVDEMPDRKHLLSKADVNWISQKYYDEFSKIHILSEDPTKNLVKLLKKSGNGDVIKKNEEIRKKKSEEAFRRRGFEHTRYLKNSYFEHIQKARDFAAENNFSKAIKEYQKAIENHDEFFQSDFLNVEMKRNVPEKSLTPEDIDYIMMIYRKTHPLLTSNRHSQKINAQIIDLLGGEWDERLTEVDRQAAQILEQRKLERQKKIEKAEDIAVDVIVGARIVGNNIFKRLKR